MVDRSDIDERIDKCNKILDENPSSQIFAALAEAYRKKGDFERAFRVCQNGLKVHPDYGSAHLVMAKINLDKGMYDWAETELHRAIELDGNTRATELLLSEIYIYKGEFNKACRLLEKLHQGDPENTQIKKLLDIARKIPLENRQIDSGTIKAHMMGISSSDSQPVATMEPPPKAGKKRPAAIDKIETDSTPVEPDLNFKQLLKAINSSPGVDGSLLMNKDGLVLEADWNIPGETDLIGALAVEAAASTASQMRQTGLGNLQSMMIETGSSFYYLAGAKGKVLAIVCAESVNLGSLKLKLSSLLPRIIA